MSRVMRKEEAREAKSPVLPGADVVLDMLVRDGARQMLQKALEEEVETFISRRNGQRDEQGRRRIVRNGYLPRRTLLTGAGPLEIEQPRARDREGRVSFASGILPPYLRRTKKINDLIPWLYLKGISTGDFSEALRSLLGPQAKGVSANVVVKLKEIWAKEFETWSRRDLSKTEYVYFWADGVYFNIRLDDDRQCILVIMGATQDGRKEIVAVRDGYRESEQSWRELLLDMKAHGLKAAPKIAVGDGALGFWAALEKIFPATRQQRCWVHKTANVLDKMPKSVQARAKNDLHEIWMASTRKDAEKAFDVFIEKYGAKFTGAVDCLRKDRCALLTFYDFPAEHWIHLRTTNPVESTFATIRLRHRKTKGNGSRRACLAMVFKLAQSAQNRWRRLNSPEHIAHVLEGRSFVDGVMQVAA